ncbi:MAG: glycerophosphodiester phosphodiesterase family protein [Candidatus Solibacter usitatus]|nr:glycerophosphodiester phosphodiesterase family protein [Candidatus Solibacter usitatus]
MTALGAAAAPAAGRKIVVIAHRGEHLRNPENTLPAFQEAIRLECDYIEVDVRTTADGKLVLMHDSTADRMTNGKGAIREMTFSQVRALETRGGARVPTFEEALDLFRGKIGVYVDVKQAAARDVVDALVRSGMQDHAVIYAPPQYLKEVAGIEPRLRGMPEAGSAAHARTLVETLHPKVIAFDARDFQDDIIAVARQAGADIYVDRLGPADNERQWQDAVDRGATGIQTDRPEELIRYLKSKGLR